MADKYEIFELLEAHENQIMELYKTYASVFPEFSNFWNALAQEESSHAALISQLKKKAQEKNIEVNTKRFKPELLKTTINYLKREAEKAKKKKIDIMYAMTNALEIEKSMIEREYFEVMNMDPEDLKKALAYLNESTKRHVERVKIIWEEIRGGQYS